MSFSLTLGGALSAAIVGALGIAAAVWPPLWSALFTDRSEVLYFSALYLRNELAGHRAPQAP